MGEEQVGAGGDDYLGRLDVGQLGVPDLPLRRASPVAVAVLGAAGSSTPH